MRRLARPIDLDLGAGAIQADEADVGAEDRILGAGFQVVGVDLDEVACRGPATLGFRGLEAQYRAFPDTLPELHLVHRHGDEVTTRMIAAGGDPGYLVDPFQQKNAEQVAVVVEMFGTDEIGRASCRERVS
jgi:hypothetical protein